MHGTGEPLSRFTTEVPDGARDQARAVADVLLRAQRVLVCGNTGADGDVVGSSLALACVLRHLGKDVVVYNDEPYPAAFSWLPGGDSVVRAIADDATFDATVVVDAARMERLGTTFPDARRRGTFCWVDHHRHEAPPGDVNYVDLTACAVGEQVAMIVDALADVTGRPLLSPDVARCIYASVVSDTGGFRYGSTTARAFRLAARLVEAGVDPWAMTERIYENQDEARVRLLGRALHGLWRSPCGRVGVVVVRLADLRELGAVEDHVRGLVNHVRGVRGVEVAVLLQEIAPAQTRVVFRSRGNVPIAPIARALGGDGEKNAAHLVLPVDVDAARAAVTAASLAVLASLDVTMPGGNAE